MWREADERSAGGGRGRRTAAGGSAGPALVRVVAGALFVVGGLAVFLLGHLDLGPVQFGADRRAGHAGRRRVITVPWWLRLVRDLGDERRERIREAERAPRSPPTCTTRCCRPSR